LILPNEFPIFSVARLIFLLGISQILEQHQSITFQAPQGPALNSTCLWQWNWMKRLSALLAGAQTKDVQANLWLV
jgi:hypothetical protein